MSKYTTEVRYICETAAGYDESKGFNDVDSIIADSIPSIFSFDFPIFDENYREVICTKILRHYYTREIGLETVGLWKLKLQTKLNEVMPYYNQLYQSELIKFNPLYDVDLNTTHVGNKDGETIKEENRSGVASESNSRSESGSQKNNGNIVEGENRTGSNVSDGKNTEVNSNNENSTDNKVRGNNVTSNDVEGGLNYDLYSDTPQGALNGVDSEEYLTNARKIKDSKTKVGKRDEGETIDDTYSKTGNASTIGESNVNTSYDEKNDKTTVSNNEISDSRTGSSNSNRNNMENMSGSDKFNSTESYIVHVVGKQAGVSYSKLLKEFRDTFLNIDMDVINSLSDLFMNLW